MVTTRFGWFRRATATLGVVGMIAAALAAALAQPLRAQDDDLSRACGAYGGGPAAECRLAAGAARLIQPRLAAAIWGGNAVQGTASTLGMRIGSMPRLSLAGRVTLAPVERPPLTDRTRTEGDRAILAGFAVDGSVGLLSGFSPVPTVGGLLSLDLIGRLGYLPLPDDGFEDGGALGWSLGARLGVFRESFTLPGVSLTASYGRISEVAFGDPDNAATDGYFEGPVTDLRAALTVGKRIALVGLTAGVAFDRYSSDLDVGFRSFPGAPQLETSGEAIHDRWSAYANASWTLLIFHLSGELGWQESPLPDGLPPGLELDPVGWYAGVAFRASI